MNALCVACFRGTRIHSRNYLSASAINSTTRADWDAGISVSLEYRRSRYLVSNFAKANVMAMAISSVLDKSIADGQIAIAGTISRIEEAPVRLLIWSRTLSPFRLV
jgi:hypothetical protein